LPGIVGAANAEERTAQQQLAFDIFKELVEINTVTATGDTARAAGAMAERLRGAGFPAADVQVFTPAPRKGNIVARLRGTGVRKSILLLAHLDVVEARREDWSMDPFTLIEQDGHYYGRGTSDDKFMVAAFVANMIRYHQEGYKPERDVDLRCHEARGRPCKQCVATARTCHHQLPCHARRADCGCPGDLGAGLG
jgi:acetylornithine deacetylase/succinyl-diaminopimelate desuccinylase-like protein